MLRQTGKSRTQPAGFSGTFLYSFIFFFPGHLFFFFDFPFSVISPFVAAARGRYLCAFEVGITAPSGPGKPPHFVLTAAAAPWCHPTDQNCTNPPRFSSDTLCTRLPHNPPAISIPPGCQTPSFPARCNADAAKPFQQLQGAMGSDRAGSSMLCLPHSLKKSEISLFSYFFPLIS